MNAQIVSAAQLPGGPRLARALGLEVEWPQVAVESQAALRPRVARANAAITLLSHRVDEAFFAASPQLKVVANYAVGYDNVNVEAASERGIVVCHTPDVLTDATADLTMALLLAVCRRLPEAETLARSGTWNGWAPDQLLGRGLRGARLGIIGFGRIGQAVATRAAGFKLEIAYSSPRKEANPWQAEQMPLPVLLSWADIVTVHCPLTPATHHLLDRAAIASMKPDAYLINTARGDIVDQSALIDALREKRIGGAGLDVFAEEPEIPDALRGLSNVVLTPHVGSATTHAREEMTRLCLEGVASVLAGQMPDNALNPQVTL